MSKKTNAEKQKAARKKPRRRAHRRGLRPNPTHQWNSDVSFVFDEKKTPSNIFDDPIFMHNALSCISRLLELRLPCFNPNKLIDAEFLEDLETPKGIIPDKGDKGDIQ